MPRLPGEADWELSDRFSDRFVLPSNDWILYMLEDVDVSIIVCTRNRADQLDRCLDALASVTSTVPWEIVVVDNGSTDSTGEVIDKHRRLIPRLINVYEARAGLGFARNAGLQIARGDIVSFTDDDCYITPTFVDDVKLQFDMHPEVAFLGGRILRFDPRDLPITIEESTVPRVFEPFSFLKAGLLHGANMSFRRSHLQNAGGFDGRLGAGTPFPCEDTDAVARLIWSGHGGRYSPIPTVYHHHGRQTEADRLGLLKAYDSGRGAYYAKYIMRKDTRWAYLAAFVQSAGADLVKERSFKRTLRELGAGLRWYRSNRRSRIASADATG